MKKIEDAARFLSETGLLFQINRSVLHPLGLALEVSVDDKHGDIQFGRIWDCRECDEGIVYGDESFKEGSDKFEEYLNKFGSNSINRRKKTFGFVEQVNTIPNRDNKIHVNVKDSIISGSEIVEDNNIDTTSINQTTTAKEEKADTTNTDQVIAGNSEVNTTSVDQTVVTGNDKGVGIEHKDVFILKGEHIKLLQSMYVDWSDCYQGAPCIDCKRPYGNSNVVSDIIEILELDIDISSCSADKHRELLDLHYGTRHAMQILLCTGKLEVGTYERNRIFQRSWKKIK
jgi:hypothetical protein